MAGGVKGHVTSPASNIRKFLEIQKFFGNFYLLWPLAQTRFLSLHSFKFHSYIVDSNHSVCDTDWTVLLLISTIH